MRLFQLNTQTSHDTLIRSIGVDKGAVTILSNKMQLHFIKIEAMHVAAANILKQDALSIGADLAVPKGVITCENKEVDALLIATTKQLKILAKKELAQPFKLKEVAHYLQKIVSAKKAKKREIMGVLNANEDSFFEQSRFNSTTALTRINTMIKEGATIIDIGGVSSRPGSQAVAPQEELDRVKNIVDLVRSEKLYEKARFSIDSYEPMVIEYALRSGFTIVNDITGLKNDEVCKLAAMYQASVVIMHMQGTPQDMQKDPRYDHIIEDINNFFYERIAKARSFGIEDIMLDVGIGFGKTLEDNLMLLKHLNSFRIHGYELLVGASRKSMIDAILPTPIEERLPATLQLHSEAYKNGATIIRCHDVKEHVQAFSVLDALDKTV